MTRQHRTARSNPTSSKPPHGDLPLFSNTPQPEYESVFTPKEEAQAIPMFDRREYIAKKPQCAHNWRAVTNGEYFVIKYTCDKCGKDTKSLAGETGEYFNGEQRVYITAPTNTNPALPQAGIFIAPPQK